MAVKKLLAATIIASISGIANAGMMITDWGYVNEAGFADNSWTASKGDPSAIVASGDPVGANPNLLGGTAFTTLTWGNGVKNGVPGIINNGLDNLQSSLVVDSPTTDVDNGGSIVTNGATAQGTDITHNNWVVLGGDGTLESALLVDALLLMPQTLGGLAFDFSTLGLAAVPAPLLNFNILFEETVNNVDYSLTGNKAFSNDLKVKSCDNGLPDGVGVNENGCADIFVVEAPQGVTPVVTNDGIEFSVKFDFAGIEELEGFEYTLTTLLTGLDVVTPEACEIVGADPDCVGFLTKEEASNVMEASFKISAREITTVPEPSMIVLMGLGFVGMGAMSRKRKTAIKNI